MPSCNLACHHYHFIDVFPFSFLFVLHLFFRYSYNSSLANSGSIRSADSRIFSGALKANIGHLEGASGIAGLIKTILILEKGIIPTIANLEHLNPRIDAEFFNLKVQGSNKIALCRY